MGRFFHLRSAICVALVLAIPIPGAAPSPGKGTHPPSLPRHPGASPECHPPVFSVDEAGLRVFRSLAGRIPMDSTRHWEYRHGRLRISYDLMREIEKLAGGDRAGRGLVRSFASSLAAQGLDLEGGEVVRAAYFPDDPLAEAGKQWPIRNSGAERGGRPGVEGVDLGISKVWDKFSGADTLVIAVLDAGFDFTHPDLRSSHWVNRAEADGLPGIDDDGNGYVDDSVGWDFVSDDNDPQDRHGHGTMTGSIIAGAFDNGIGLAGIAPEVRIMPVRVLNAAGLGDLAAISKGILYAVRNGAKAINYSIGSGSGSQAMRSAFQAAQAAGVPIAIAAGNNHVDLNAHPAFPAAYPFDNLLVVAAHDHAGKLCGFSNYGRTVVHLAAPGEFIPVCDIHPPKHVWIDFFESETLAWDTTGAWKLSSTDPFEGKQSLEWIAGDTATLTLRDTLDLRGIDGGVLLFQAAYHGADTSDVLLVEGNRIGTATWSTLAILSGDVDSMPIPAIGMEEMDGSRFRLRFRTLNNPRFDAAGRRVKIDQVFMRIPDPDPRPDPVYLEESSGTSVAAPYVAAYAGLLRLACDRMGVPFTRARALTGVVADPDLAGKVSTGGRLDIYKGLEFYLKTLPALVVTDSAAVSWKTGDRIEYALSIDPAAEGLYAFSVTGLPAALDIDGAGKLTWTPSQDQTGAFALRFKAAGPTILRRRLEIQIDPAGPVSLEHPIAGLRTWSLDGRRFVLPPGLETGRHRVEISALDAAGRRQVVAAAWMEAPALGPAPRIDRGLAPGFRAVSVQVDGIPLKPAP